MTTSHHVKAIALPEGEEPIDLWVEDGRITDERVAHATTLPGRYVSRGLVDAHTHLSIPFADCLGHRRDPVIRRGEWPEPAELVLRNARRQLRSGVLAIRDAGYVRRLALDAAALPSRPIVQRSGWMVVPPGRYFEAVGKDTPPDALEARVREVAQSGLRWFKVIADFPGGDLDLFEAPPNYDASVLRRACEVAHEHGMRVMAHSTGRFVAEVVEAGVDTIEHGASVTPDVVRAMAARGTGWVPTLATVEAHLRMMEGAGSPATTRLAWEERMRESLPLAVALGVPVLAGGDELPHGSFATEIEALVRHGLTARQAIAAATTVAERVLGLEGLHPGAAADLVTWDEDPREDVKRLRHPRAILAAGARVPLSEDDDVA